MLKMELGLPWLNGKNGAGFTIISRKAIIWLQPIWQQKGCSKKWCLLVLSISSLQF